MSRLVVDASVVFPLFVQEEHSERCARVTAAAETLFAPALLWPELMNVLWKHAQRGLITREHALACAASMRRAAILTIPTRPLALPALELATNLGISAYDATYLAAAIQNQFMLLTADRRLARAVASSAYKDLVAWVGDLPD